jgi:hypothetical protein
VSANGSDFRLDNNDLCRLNAASTEAAMKCTAGFCPYPTCACTKLTSCPSGATKSASTSVNPATPFYPAEHVAGSTICCPVGMGPSLLEQLVTADHLDCSVGRPCVVTTVGGAAAGTQVTRM